ncbi:MAG: hypothetical protein Tsb0021_02460 [Chlamydiales bacterium]
MSEIHASIGDHLECLRRVFLRSLGIFLITVFVAFGASDLILRTLTDPLKSDFYHGLKHVEMRIERIENVSGLEKLYPLPCGATITQLSVGVRKESQNQFLIPSPGFIEFERELPKNSLALFSPMEGIVNTIKISIWGGCILCLPFWLFFLAQFIFPALTPYEARLLIPFSIVSLISLGFSIYIALHLSIPFANQFFFSFNAAIGQNIWSLSHYLTFALSLILCHAAALQLSLILIFLIFLEILELEVLQTKRRHVILGSFVLSAVLTPPDVFSQIILSLFFIAIYEIGIFIALVKRRRRKRNFAELIRAG